MAHIAQGAPFRAVRSETRRPCLGSVRFASSSAGGNSLSHSAVIYGKIWQA